MKHDRSEMVQEGDREETAELVEQLRAECERNRDVLRDLVRIHLSIDEPARSIGADEPDWICRLRKICFHVRAIETLGIDVDIAHVMAPELRAAYVQMDAVWKSMPRKYKLDEVNSGWWATEARDGMLATYDHPTPIGLVLLRAGRGGFHSGEVWENYTRLALWLGYLGLGYGLALWYLAAVRGVDGEVDSRLEAAVTRGSGQPLLTARALSVLRRGWAE